MSTTTLTSAEHNGHAWGLRASRAQPADPERATNTTGFRVVVDGGG